MSAPVASTPFGEVAGFRRDGVDVFKGIRYATADRFAPAEPVTGWAGTYDATTYRPHAPQLVGTLERMLGASRLPTGEDCLHLNVFTPGCDDARRPVLVWVHGGAFVTGGGAVPWYEGSSLVRRGDVVVVTINYRLGALGFTGLRNDGLGDQLTALRWVHEAIAAFGGDPGNVTIFGESAGGASVVALMASPSSAGLFRRAVAMSPSIPQLRDTDTALDAEQRLLAAAGVTDVEALAALPLEQLLAAQGALLADPAFALQAFSPAAGGRDAPDDLLEAAATDDRPLLIGTTRDEMHLFNAFDPARAALDQAATERAFERRFGERTADALERYRAVRPGATNGQLVSAVQTDETFRAPAWALADRRTAAGAPSWMYWFTWATPAFGGVLGSCHGLDVPFAFHNLARPGVEVFTGDGVEREAVADAFSGAVLAVAHRGDPGWAQYDDRRRATRIVDVPGRDVDDPECEIRRLWQHAG